MVESICIHVWCIAHGKWGWYIGYICHIGDRYKYGMWDVGVVCVVGISVVCDMYVCLCMICGVYM